MNRLKELRNENNLTQKEIADMLNIARSTYNTYELDKNEISIENLKKLANFYNVTVDYLIGYEPTEHNMSVVNNALKFAQDIGLTDEKIKNLTPKQLNMIQMLIDTFSENKED